MNLNIRIEALVQLGDFFLKFTSKTANFSPKEEHNVNQLNQAITLAKQTNGWFTKEDINFTLKHWGQKLNQKNLDAHTAKLKATSSSHNTVALITENKTPLADLNDVLNVFLSGHRTLVRQKSNKRYLLLWIRQFLKEQDEQFAQLIEITDKPLKQFDAVIATKEANKTKHFKHYFSKQPHIIREHKHAVGLLKGNESSEDLHDLGESIFRYFGLSRNNISKLFVPQDYDFTPFFEAIYSWHSIINHHKYASNYDYNKAVYLMSQFKLLENGFLILKEDKTYQSPVACLFYEYYEHEDQLQNTLKNNAEHIGQIASNALPTNTISFSETMPPDLNDYPESVNIMEFLNNL